VRRRWLMRKKKCDRCGKEADYFFEIIDTYNRKKKRMCMKCGKEFHVWWKKKEVAGENA